MYRTPHSIGLAMYRSWPVPKSSRLYQKWHSLQINVPKLNVRNVSCTECDVTPMASAVISGHYYVAWLWLWLSVVVLTKVVIAVIYLGHLKIVTQCKVTVKTITIAVTKHKFKLKSDTFTKKIDWCPLWTGLNLSNYKRTLYYYYRKCLYTRLDG